MSRTYRKDPRFLYKALGKFWLQDEWDKMQEALTEAYGKMENRWMYYGVKMIYDYDFKKNRDHKGWNKPPKWYKQMNRRCERAKVKSAMANDKEIPFFRNGDQWSWT